MEDCFLGKFELMMIIIRYHTKFIKLDFIYLLNFVSALKNTFSLISISTFI